MVGYRGNCRRGVSVVTEGGVTIFVRVLAAAKDVCYIAFCSLVRLCVSLLFVRDDDPRVCVCSFITCVTRSKKKVYVSVLEEIRSL